MTRPRFETRVILLRSPKQVEVVRALAGNVPLDPERPIQVVFREEPKQRTLEANARMWVGPLKDLAEQAWVDGRQFSIEVWHEWCKREFLPDPDQLPKEELAKRVKKPEAYVKWEYGPDGERLLVGSTTALTPFGFGEYVTRIEAYGAGLGVQFSASPHEVTA